MTDAVTRAKELLKSKGITISESNDIPYALPTDLGQADWDGFETPNHIMKIQDYLMKVVDGDIKKLGIYMPPRHGKSETISVYFLAWYIITHPDKRVIFVSYGHDFAAEFGLRVRDIVNEFGGNVKIRQDSRQKNKFMIKGHRGSCTFTGIGGSITGKGADLFIIDDPVKGAVEAMSDTYRENAKHWYRTVANTRLEPGAAQIIIQTRWHEDDLSGWLLKEQPGQWTIISLPAIAEEDDDIGRKPGEALWPERYPIEELTRLREETGSFWFSAMYQQNPQPAEGGLFKRNWIVEQTLPAEALGDYSVMTIDLAIGGKKENDRTVIVTVVPTKMPGKLYVKNIRYGRWRHRENIDHFINEYYTYQPSAAYAESTAYQDAFRQDIIYEHKLPLMKLDNRGSKEQRIIQTLQPMFEAGKIIFPENAPWIDDLLQEYLSFPNARHDDMMDALEMAVRKAQMMMVFVPYTPKTTRPKYYDFTPGSESGDSLTREKIRERLRKEQDNNPYGISHSNF